MARKDLPTPSLSGVTQLNWHKAHKVSVHAGTNITQMRLNSGFSKPKLVRGRALQTLLGPRIPKTLNSPCFRRFSAICHIHLFFWRVFKSMDRKKPSSFKNPSCERQNLSPARDGVLTTTCLDSIAFLSPPILVMGLTLLFSPHKRWLFIQF